MSDRIECQNILCWNILCWNICQINCQNICQIEYQRVGVSVFLVHCHVYYQKAIEQIDIYIYIIATMA